MDKILSQFHFERKHLDFACPRSIIDRIADEIIDEWNLVGRALNVSKTKQDSVRNNRSLILPEDQAVAILDAWADEHGAEATCLKLAKALFRRRKKRVVEILCEEVTAYLERRRDDRRTTPSGVTPSEQLWDPEGNQWQQVANSMRRETERDLMENFAHLVTLITSKLSQEVRDVKSFRFYLNTYLQQQSVSVSIPDTTDISMIIDSMGDQKLWDYCNYRDIELIAVRHLTKNNLKQVQSALNQHKEKVKNYNTTRSIAGYIEEKLANKFRDLTVSQPRGFQRNSKRYYDKLSLTLHVSIRKKTLTYVRDLWEKIQYQFCNCLPECNAVLNHIYSGSVVIVWLIPSSASPEMKRPQPWSSIHFLQETLISRMVLIDSYCIYDEQDSMNLIRVSSEGDFDEVSFLLRSEDKGAAVNATFEEIEDGKSSLIIASEAGHELVMLNLLDWGANVNFQLKASGRSALFFAAENGHNGAVTILLAYGADPYLTDMMNGETAYSVAKKKLGNEKVCKELEQIESKKRVAVKSISTSQQISEKLEEARVTVFQTFYQTYQLLASDLVGAARDDNMTVVEYILENHKADVNSRQPDRHQWTPLTWATENGDFEMVDFLLKKGADPNLATKDTRWTSLQLASRKGRLKIAKALLDNAADPNAQNSEGVSALAIAAYENRTALAMLLIHRGADIHLPAYNGWTPLIHASAEGNLKLMKVLSDLGSNLNDPTEEGWTSTMVASHCGHTEIVNELAKRRASLDLTTDAGDTALHIASLQGHAEVVKELARHRANLNVINKDGLTALMVAVNKGHLSVVDVLLEHNADVNIELKGTGWTAIFFAAENGRVDIVKQLLHHGAKSELADGTTLIDVALSDLKRMQIIDVLGTSVDETKVPLRKDPGYVYQGIANLLDSLVTLLGKRRARLVGRKIINFNLRD